MFKQITTTELQHQINLNKDVVVMDVRTPLEWSEGVIEGSVLIDIMGGTFMDEIEKLDKDKTYYLVCRSGNRSQTACSVMAQRGFKDLANVVGGMMSWEGNVVEYKNNL